VPVGGMFAPDIDVLMMSARARAHPEKQNTPVPLDTTSAFEFNCIRNRTSRPGAAAALHFAIQLNSDSTLVARRPRTCADQPW